jgi:hypothetical protein
MKTHLDLRPVNHRKEERIRSHVLLCWLALLLIRIAENQIPTRTWRHIREELQTLHVGEFTGNAGHVHQRTELTTAQRNPVRLRSCTSGKRRRVSAITSIRRVWSCLIKFDWRRERPMAGG